MKPSHAASITYRASKQTYYTIRLLVDRPRTENAFRAYGYFRWVDDVLDAPSSSGLGLSDSEVSERILFLARQKSLLDQCLRGEPPIDLNLQEQMLVELVQSDQEQNTGLAAYLVNMMLVMDFDLKRRGCLVSLAELNDYTRWLAVAVTEAMDYFIGHGEYTPQDDTRYLAVTAAHITHMIRDTYVDLRDGYYNIPREVLEANHIGPRDVGSRAYRNWVRNRTELARQYFEAGKGYFRRVQNSRHRLAGFAYIARFEWLLDTIGREDYVVRPDYNERKSTGIGFKMGWLALSSMVNFHGAAAPAPQVVSHRGGKI